MSYSYKTTKAGLLTLLNGTKTIMTMNFENDAEAKIWADNWVSIWNANIEADESNTYEKSILPQDEA
jgi:hypothetical protein